MILFEIFLNNLFQVETTNPGKLKADERYIAENPVSHVSNKVK